MAALLGIVNGGLDSLDETGEGASTPSWFCPGVTPVLLQEDIFFVKKSFLRVTRCVRAFGCSSSRIQFKTV